MATSVLILIALAVVFQSVALVFMLLAIRQNNQAAENWREVIRLRLPRCPSTSPQFGIPCEGFDGHDGDHRGEGFTWAA